jgi:hypothetical protein
MFRFSLSLLIYTFIVYFWSYFSFFVLGIKSKALHTLGKCRTIELPPIPKIIFFLTQELPLNQACNSSTQEAKARESWLKSSLGYITRPCLKNKQTNKKQLLFSVSLSVTLLIKNYTCTYVFLVLVEFELRTLHLLHHLNHTPALLLLLYFGVGSLLYAPARLDTVLLLVLPT